MKYEEFLKSKEKMEMEVFEENFISGNFVIKEIIPPNGMVFCEMKRKIQNPRLKNLGFFCTYRKL